MISIKKSILASAVALAAASGSASATVTFQSGLNDIFFNNYENAYRTEANCNTFGGCLAPTLNDPAGYQLVDLNQSANIIEGDVFAGIFSVQNVDNGGGTIWAQVPGSDEFGGYFAQEVLSVDSATGPHTLDFTHIALGNPSTDPFGILAAGEMFRLWVDDTGLSSFNTVAGGSLLASIATAIDGTFWGSLGLTDGYAYSHVDFSTTIFDNTADNNAFSSLDVILEGPGYNAGTLIPINDFTENEVGGLATSPVTGTCVQLGIAPITCNDVVGTSELEGNPSSFLAGGQSPWLLRSNDPFSLYVPEPGVLGLMGLAALGMAGIRRRKQK